MIFERILNKFKKTLHNFQKFNFLLNSLGGRKFFQLTLETIFFIENSKRNRLKTKLLDNNIQFEINDDDGFLMCPSNTFKSQKDAVKNANDIFQIEKQHLDLNGQKKNTHLVEIPLKKHLTKDSPLMNFALDSEVIKTVSKYLNTVPVLREVRMMYSPNNGEFEGGSQMFHIDKEYPRMMKIFLFITPSSNQDGPLTTFSAKNSKMLIKKIGLLKSIHRITDEHAFKDFSKDDTRTIIGEKGSVGFLDTGRCLHFGSRPTINSKPRLIVWYVYHHFCANKFPFSLKGGERFDFQKNNSDQEPINSILTKS